MLAFCPVNQKSYSSGITVEFRNEEESRAFHCAFEQWKKEVVVQGWYNDIFVGVPCRCG